jgi:hypothetical protein
MSLILSGTDGLSDVDGSAATPAIRGTDSNTGIFFPAADTIAFAEGGAEIARFDASGNLGIGTISPGTKLDVTGQITTRGSIGALVAEPRDGTGAAWSIYNPTGDDLRFFGNSDDRMVLTNSGNLGLGVTPSALWQSGRKALQIGASGAIHTFGSTPSQIVVAANNYFNGTDNVYLNTGLASQYNQTNGVHSWFTAPSGTAGNAITFTQAMTLDASGNLLVGTTSVVDFGFLSLKYNGTTSNGIVFSDTSNSGTTNACSFKRNSTTTVGAIQLTTTTTAYVTSSDYRLKHDIQPMTGALAKVAQLKPVTYKWNADGSDGEGFIAHELAKVVPQCVTGEKDAVDAEGNPVYQGIDTSFLVATLTSAIQEQQVLIQEIKAELAALKGEA